MEITSNYSRLCMLMVAMLLCASMARTQTYNLITSGDMESGGWSDVPGNTNLTTSMASGQGLDGSTGYKTITSSMGGDSYYILRCDDLFHMTQSDQITVSFWAKGSVSNMRLQPWVQESDGYQWMNFGDAYLTTSWKQYRFTVNISSQTSNNYKVKFRGYDTGTMYIDNVQIGPVDYENVNQSGIYEVTVAQNGKSWPLNVFRNSAPAYQLGYQNMESKDKGPLDLFAGRSINWTKFNFDDPITVHVKVINTTKVPVSGQSVSILPSRHGVTSTTSGNVVSFTISEPGQYSVEIGANGYKNGLMIFADPEETDIPSQSDPDYLVLYEADASDISSIPTSYDGVYFRRGVHDIGVFNIPSHIKNIYFEDGSWVYGALKMDGDPNVRIYGRGVLSSNNFNYRQTHCVEAINGSNNITIEGLVVADPKYFAVRLIGTDNDVSYTKVIGGWVYNCDGIAAFKGSSVSKSFIWANDDAIKVYRDSISFTDIVVWQLNNGGVIQMGWGGAIGGSTSKDVEIKRVDVLRAEWDKPRFNTALLGLVGNHYHDAGRYALVEDWLIEDVVTEHAVPIVFNMTPDPYTDTDIHGLTLKDWDVEMTMGTSFVNQIKGTDPNDFFSGFVFDNVVFNDQLLTNINYITTGDMESGGWVGVPKTTDQTVILGSGLGTGGSKGLRSVVTDMGGGNHYIMKANEKFHLTNGQNITVTFWARATAAGKKLVPWVQNTDNNDWMNVGEVYLSTNWEWYSTSAPFTGSTSDNYQVKFRGYETAWMFIDKVQVGTRDWRTITKPELEYLNTPTFLPLPPGSTMNNSETLAGIRNEPLVGIYPNPATNVIYIQGIEPETPVQIYSPDGNLVLQGKGPRHDVSGLSPDLYIVKAGGRPSIKMIIK